MSAVVEAIFAVIGALTVLCGLALGVWIAACEIARRPAHRMNRATRARSRIDLRRK